MKCFDAKYNRLPKAELHCHREGAIRTATTIDIARECGLDLPASYAADALLPIWSMIATVTNITGTVEWPEAGPPAERHFYRAQVLNP